MPLTVGSERLQVADIIGNCFASSLKNTVCCSKLAWSDSPLARSLDGHSLPPFKLPPLNQATLSDVDEIAAPGIRWHASSAYPPFNSASSLLAWHAAEASRRDAPHPTTVYKAIAQGTAIREKLWVQQSPSVKRNREGMRESRQLFLSLLPTLMSCRTRSVPTKDDSEVEEISRPSVVQALFHRNRHFRISGGTFNLTVQRKEKEFENFRRIRLGDIVLGKDIGGGVRRVDGRNVVRHVYTAKIVEMELPMTVAIYEGQEKDLKEKWDEYIPLHVGLRHPNVFPLFGITLSQGLCAAIYHDEYVSYEQMRQVYSVSPTHRIYFFKFFKEEFEAHGSYIALTTDSPVLTSAMCTSWFHPSGKMCIEVDFDCHEVGQFWESPPLPCAYRVQIIHPSKYLLPPVEPSRLIDSMDLEYYYFHLFRYQLCRIRTIPLARHSTVRPHSLVKHAAGNLQEIAFQAQVYSDLPKWSVFVDDAFYGNTSIRPNGWTRVLLVGNDILDASFRLPFKTIKARGDQTSPSYPLFRQLFAWFAQANYIFGRLDLNCSSCSYIDSICVDCTLTSYIQPRSPEKIFLFLPPYNTFLSADLTRYGFPREGSYWSFDPCGNDRLSANEALNLGLPQARIDISVTHYFVDDAFLKDVHAFHARKGFDPDRQEIAEHLGLALYCFADSEDPSPLPISWPELVDRNPALIAECPESEFSSNVFSTLTPEERATTSDRLDDFDGHSDDTENLSDDEQILYPHLAT
ncbi:hypothetical protein R3P38DRAFT_3367905 [Favolaschia claudopus]|uniref:Uncharacterized protein n=1 Tax=Favolaschia claudopus TaxID=2862362 RepID=A0AAW0A7T2_9AGAR